MPNHKRIWHKTKLTLPLTAKRKGNKKKKRSAIGCCVVIIIISGSPFRRVSLCGESKQGGQYSSPVFNQFLSLSQKTRLASAGLSLGLRLPFHRTTPLPMCGPIKRRGQLDSKCLESERRDEPFIRPHPCLAQTET